MLNKIKNVILKKVNKYLFQTKPIKILKDSNSEIIEHVKELEDKIIYLEEQFEDFDNSEDRISEIARDMIDEFDRTHKDTISNLEDQVQNIEDSTSGYSDDLEVISNNVSNLSKLCDDLIIKNDELEDRVKMLENILKGKTNEI